MAEANEDLRAASGGADKVEGAAEGGEQKEELKLELTEDQKLEIKDVFDIFDKHKEGQIPSTDLGVVLRVLNLNPTESELEEMINEVDPTKSQFIDLNAVYLLYERKQKDTDTLEELVEALKMFDYDKDGKLSTSEFRWAMTSLGEQLQEETVDGMVEEGDKEKTGFIDILEFAKLCFNIKEK